MDVPAAADSSELELGVIGGTPMFNIQRSTPLQPHHFSPDQLHHFSPDQLHPSRLFTMAKKNKKQTAPAVAVTMLYQEPPIQRVMEFPPTSKVEDVEAAGYEELLGHLFELTGFCISRDDVQINIYPEVPATSGTTIQDFRSSGSVAPTITFLYKLPSSGSSKNTAATRLPPVQRMAAELKETRRWLKAAELIIEEFKQAEKQAKSERKKNRKGESQRGLAIPPDNQQISALQAKIRTLEEELEAETEKSEAAKALQQAELGGLRVGFTTAFEDRVAINNIRHRVLLDLGRDYLATICGHTDWDTWVAAFGNDRDRMHALALTALAQVPLHRHWTNEALHRLVIRRRDPLRNRGNEAAHNATIRGLECSVLSLPEGGQERVDMFAIYELVFDGAVPTL
ncbi:hypothetical protein BD779DRAFT_1476841 [Infundibulicybe gibba]|nr:hypothetical protein BD779DRAFT_1476841 [Infundibulicybe gibba]